MKSLTSQPLLHIVFSEIPVSIPLTQYISNIDGIEIYMTTWKSSVDQKDHCYNAQIHFASPWIHPKDFFLDLRDHFIYERKDLISDFNILKVENEILVVEGRKRKSSVPNWLYVCPSCDGYSALGPAYCPHCRKITCKQVLSYRDYWILSYGNESTFKVDLGRKNSKALSTIVEAKKLIDEIQGAEPRL